MQAIHIRRLHARYHLRAHCGVQPRRLDRVLNEMLHQSLEEAIEQAGFSPDDQVCIRRLFVPVHLRMSASDRSLAESWSRALADAMRNAVIERASAAPNRHHTLEVARYPSRMHALVEMTDRVGCEDLSRAWAWRQLGFWQAGDRVSSAEAVREWVRALVREPMLLVPVLTKAAEQGSLAKLADRLGATHWLALAGAALTIARATVDWRDLRRADRLSLASAGAAALAVLRAPTPLQETIEAAQRVLTRSSLAAGFGLHRLPTDAMAAVSALVLLEVQPVLVTQVRDRVLTMINAVVAAFNTRANTELDTSASGKPEAATAANALPEENLCPSAEPIEVEEKPAAPATDLRSRGFTDWGGLLFLVNVFDHLDLPSRIAAAFPHRLFRGSLHRLAMTFAPVAPEDPAALAFAGIAPGSLAPGADEEPLSAAETGALRDFVEEIRAETARRLVQVDLTPEKLLEFVCARRAEIVADPGWIEVRFALATVATELRRAALDLDPGYVPWMGVVVRFVYE